MNELAPLDLKPGRKPIVIEHAYSEDQHRRLLKVARDHGPWELIIAQHFKSPVEVVASSTGTVSEDADISWDMFLSPVFRGYLAKEFMPLFPEIEDCFYNSKFLELARNFAGAKYARPDVMVFNINGACGASNTPHIDSMTFRGINSADKPLWLTNIMAKSGLFTRWQSKKVQVISWYYKGRIGGGFNYWPDGLRAPPSHVPAPMWGRAVVTENEMMFHSAQSNGPANMRRPNGLSIDSKFAPDPHDPEGWQIIDKGNVIQRIGAEDMRFLVHWSADVFVDDKELSMVLDHSDDIHLDRVFEMLIEDLQRRGIAVPIPSDPMGDANFIRLLVQSYDLGLPKFEGLQPSEAS